MAAVSSSKWTSFYNDPPIGEPTEDDITSAGESYFSLACLYAFPLLVCDTGNYNSESTHIDVGL